jgi:pimeloyl-ACP methyl ester carboxylesterase
MRIAVAFLLVAAACGGARETEIADGAQAWQKLAEDEAMIPSGDPGIQLYVREKRPRGSDRFDANHVVLFVHGSTYPAETSFDLELNGLSWMDYIAERGYDVWLVDVRGYGRSTRPPEMSQPPEANRPVARTPVAVHDAGAAVQHILETRGVDRLCLLGWSWGTTIMASYTIEHPDKVQKLVLYAPQWLRSTPPLISGEGAYRVVSVASAKERWLKGVPADKAKDLIPPGWFESWADATFATDPVGSKQNPKTLRAPNGTIADAKDYWSAGTPLYDPTRITVPTLIVHAEWDQDLPTPMSLAVFERLTNAPYRRLVQIGEGTHTVIMERNRMQLFREVQAFLDEPQRIEDEEPQPPPAWRMIPGAGRIGLD